MSWDDFYQRRDAITTALARAARTGGRELGYAELPEVRRCFESEDELLIALHYKWSQVLTGQLRLANVEAEHDPRLDGADVVTIAWRAATRRAPALRAALDAHSARSVLRVPTAAEYRMLARFAGLTTGADSTEDVTRIGSTLINLIRTGEAAQPKARGLLRRLTSAVSA